LINFKSMLAFAVIAVLSALVLPVFAQEYDPGVTSGQFVTYGNFVGVGPGFESFNDYDWLRLEVVSVSGKQVTLLSTGRFKNGDAIPGNNTTTVWNVETGTEDGTPSTQGSIIAANLSQGDAIPPPNTYAINMTEDRTYLGVSRSVNILDVAISTPDYETSLTFVYDRVSGMLLESTSKTTQVQPETATSEYSYSIIDTNIFGPAPGNLPVGYFILIAAVVILVVVVVLVILRTKKT
jgi:hypothetical protein